MKVITGYWIKDNGDLKIKVKTNDGWKIIDPGMNPYFFIKESDLPRAIRHFTGVIKLERGDYYTIRGKKCIKVICRYPTDVRRNREKLGSLGIESYEADIPFIKRWIIDKNIDIYNKPKILFFDVEADSRKGIPLPEDPSQRILSIAGVDKDTGKEYFITDHDEIEIFYQFMKLLSRYDYVLGYNNLRWDNPYLEARAKKLGIDFDMRIVDWSDMMLLYNKTWGGGYVSLKLDEVARKELGLTKKMDLYKYRGAEGLWKMFIEDIQALREYNVWDCVLLRLLDQKYAITDLSVELATFSRVFYSDTLFNSRIIDALLLKRSMSKIPRIVHPNKIGATVGAFYKYGTYARGEERKEIPERLQGALILDPIPGIYENVINFDYTSMYPRIIRTFNIGVETLDENGEILTGKKRFKKKPRSIFAEFIEDLDKERQYYKKLLKDISPEDPKWKIYNLKQFVLKIILNASYGVIGAWGFRYYDKDVAESVTLTGREMLKILNSVLEEIGFKILYSDTDGTMALPYKISFKKFLELRDELIEFLNDEIKYRIIEKFNPPPEYYCMEVKIDAIFKKIFFGKAKKRYIGLIYPEDIDKIPELDSFDAIDKVLKGSTNEIYKKKVVGFEIKRLDIPPLIKIIQNKIFDIIFNSDSLNEARRKVIQYLNNIKEELYSGFLDTELVIEKGTRRQLDKYKANDVHVKIARELARRGIFRPGDSIQYVITEVKNGRLEGKPIIEGEPFPKISKSGYDYYWERIMMIVERIFGENIYKIDKKIEEWI